MKNLLDPVVLFFFLGALSGLFKSGIRIPKDFHSTLSIYLLLSIGIKGGIELHHQQGSTVLIPGLVTIALGMFITLLAKWILQYLGKFDQANAIAIATHYGSVSAVTFAVVTSFLHSRNIDYEEYVIVLLVMLEISSLIMGVGLSTRIHRQPDAKRWAAIKEVFLGKTVLLLLGGLFIGWTIAYSGNTQINFFFFDLFKGFLCIFMLEMGVVASERFPDLKKVGWFLLGFGILMPLMSAILGLLAGKLCGISEGGAIVLATMCASASYIAAPAAMKVVLPQANPTYYLTSALGITFPFNMLIGIQLYTALGEKLYHWNTVQLGNLF